VDRPSGGPCRERERGDRHQDVAAVSDVVVVGDELRDGVERSEGDEPDREGRPDRDDDGAADALLRLWKPASCHGSRRGW
jgi:hypothetical protein